MYNFIALSLERTIEATSCDEVKCENGEKCEIGKVCLENDKICEQVAACSKTWSEFQGRPRSMHWNILVNLHSLIFVFRTRVVHQLQGVQMLGQGSM